MFVIFYLFYQRMIETCAFEPNVLRFIFDKKNEKYSSING